MQRKEDVNEPADDERVGWAPRTVYKGVRESAARAFLQPIRHRPNLTVVTGVTVDKVIVDGKRATGISGSRDGVSVVYKAEKEVLLCAGALATPAILHRSGIGPAEVLDAIGVKLAVESPQLGYNLREHRALVMQWRTDDRVSQNREYRGVRLLANTAQYYLTRRGKMSSATYEAGAWFKTRPELDRPDAQYLIAPYSFDFGGGMAGVEHTGGMHLCAYILRPESTGTVFARSADPRALPVITPNYHLDDGDRRKMVDLVRHARTLMATSPLAQYIKGETRPSADFQSDDQIIAAFDAMGNGAYHASGTCEMGSNNATPVDARMRVRGVDGLRVCDTSVLPFLVAGNTNGPAMAMAWRGADLILADN
jgi:choline dehydrogenase-like flavoprotein